MTPFTRWLADRRRAEEQAVIRAIGMLRPSHASGWPIARLSYLSAARAYVALARLEAAGRVVSEWKPGPYPRRRVYRVARADDALERQER